MLSKIIDGRGVKKMDLRTAKLVLAEKIYKQLMTFPVHGAKDYHKLLDDVRAQLFPKKENTGPGLWEAAIIIGKYFNTYTISSSQKDALNGLITEIREFQGIRARRSKETQTIVFGTSGWRDPIGEGFTIENVHKTVRAIIKTMRTQTFLDVNGYTSFAEVQRAGIVLFRDNRFMGEEFMEAARRELAAAGIKIYDAGECTTGIGSALVTELKAAGSINFTPSHNPMDYAGLKFNPADGGPADTNITSIIEKEANAFMQPGVVFERATTDYSTLLTKIDAAAIFVKFLEKSELFDLTATRQWLTAHKDEMCVLVDNMHGSSRGYIEKIIGEDLANELIANGSLQFINTNDDPSFHGAKPEPNAANQAKLQRQLMMMKDLQEARGKKIKYTLAVALDPDGDRIRFADIKMDIDMNRFGAIAYAHFLNKKRAEMGEEAFRAALARGELGLASTAPTSDFGKEIAKQNIATVYETAVGFKNFRKSLSQGLVLVAFEESDGITFKGHTLEKCAIAGFLAAIDSMQTTDQNISEQYAALQEKYGYFYPGKAGVDVKGVSVDEWQSYKKKVVSALQTGLFKKGDMTVIVNDPIEVADVNIIDGLKVILKDRSWELLRPSGTEPQFRIYFEVVSATKLSDDEINGQLKYYEKAGAKILEDARTLVA